MQWWVWALLIYFVLQSQKPTANGATVVGSVQQPGYSGGFGINLIF